MIKPFVKIFTLGTTYIQNIFKDPVFVEEKVDGCFHYESPVLLADGTKKPIGQIVNSKMELEVVTYNIIENCFENKKIINWYKNGKSDDWIILRITPWHGQKLKIHCTPNHRIMTPEGWKEAKDFKIGDKVMYKNIQYNPIAEQVILGTMLGDSHIGPEGRLSCCHGRDQEELIYMIERILKGTHCRFDTRPSGFGSEMLRIHSGINSFTKEMGRICNCDNGIKGRGKIINDEWLQKITPISLAWWFMDDGSTSVEKTDKQKGYVTFHTERYSLKENELLQKYLKLKFNLDASIRTYKEKYHVIALTTKSTEVFYSLIAPYILKSCHYKIPSKFRTEYCFWDYIGNYFENALVEREVVDIEISNPENKNKYDIEVEGNNNYFVNNVLVHNSQFVVGKDPDGNLYMRSKGAQLYVENPQQMFKEAINYIYDIQHRIPNNTVFYCEYLQRPKHNVLKYDKIPKNNLMLFAISDYMGTKFYFDRGHIGEWSVILDVDPVPTFYEGMVNNINELMSFMEKDSYLGGTKIEGFVVKNYHNQFLLGGQPIPLMAGKFVSESFKEKAKVNWSKDHTTGGKWESFIESYRTEARWQKAIQHLAEADKLLYEPKDIGNLIKEIQRDIVDEEKEEIKEFLWKHFGSDLIRRSSSGAAEFYKEWLAKRSFEE